MTDDEYRSRAEATITQMPRCECMLCGCQYPIYSTRSKESHFCFSCRAGVHFGGTNLEKNDEARPHQ